MSNNIIESRSKFTFNIKNLNDLKRYNKIFKDLVINDVSTMKNPKNYTLIFSKNWSKEIENELLNIKNSLILIKNLKGKINNNIVNSVPSAKVSANHFFSFEFKNKGIFKRFLRYG